MAVARVAHVRSYLVSVSVAQRSLLLSSKHATIQAVVLGAAIGAFVGSTIGISSLLAR